MANGSESTSSNCGCGSDSSTKKDKGPCPSAGSDKKSGFSKTPCKKPSGKGKCHESHEQFQKKHTDSCSSCGGDSAGGKCSSSYQKFTGGVSGASPCGGSSQNECHDSYKKFQESKLEDCSNNHEVVSKQDQYCKESQVESEHLSSQTKHGPCSGSLDSAPVRNRTVPDCQSQIQKGPCSSSVDLASKKKEPPCVSKQRKPDASLYSKITSRCKNMAKDFVKPKSSTKCSGVNESPKDSICDKTIPKSLPCPPKTEKSVGHGSPVPCCTSKATCPDSKAASWSDFFPLDARNQKLNACIDKYSKIDPGQVVSKCSQFANTMVDTSERCMQQMRKTQQQCTQGTRSSEPAKKSAPLISLRSRVLASRWAPSAAMYLATSALITLYLTEWKVVPIYVDSPDGTDKAAKPA